MERKIFIDRLKNGEVERFTDSFSAKELDISDEHDLHFTSPIEIKGEAYLASDHLIVKMQVETTLSMPCAVCNEPTTITLSMPDFYHAEPTSEIKSSIFDFTEILREDILLEVPQFVECTGGKCPERENIKSYLKQEKSAASKASSGPAYFPFSDL